MLVLTRQLGQVLLIGDEIAITVVDIGHGKVRLGIEAPKDTPVIRKETVPLDPPSWIEDPPSDHKVN